jgi:8-amino-7-oxononanoate synthase
MHHDIYRLYEEELDKIKMNDAFRHLNRIQTREGKFATYLGKKYINLSSNDYLGFASDAALQKEFYRNLGEESLVDYFGPGSASSRLITGDHFLYSELEQIISDLYSDPGAQGGGRAARKEALVFNSGYHANSGILPALAGRGDIIFSDRLNHASIIDGIRLSGAECAVFGHLDYGQLANQLSQKRDSFQKAIIVSESVFSMDGDIADLHKLIEIKKRFNAILYLDEAHALGVFGASGLGISERDKAIEGIDVIIGTFGKALGSIGAFAAAAPVLKDVLINRARSLIFTTSLPPVVINWNLFALRKMRMCNDRREHLAHLAGRLRAALAEASLATGGQSQLIPVIFGDNARTIQAAETLRNRGLLVFPIRPPSVTEGGSRLRLSLRADLNWEDLEKVPEILKSLL